MLYLLKALLKHALLQDILNGVDECLLHFHCMAPHLKYHPLLADVNPSDLSAFHALHRVKNFPFKLLTDAVGLSILSIYLATMLVGLIRVEVNCQLNIMTLNLSCLDLCKSLFLTFIRQELQEYSLHCLQISFVIVLKRTSHDLLFV